jgi:signal transduction histidine kinase
MLSLKTRIALGLLLVVAYGVGAIFIAVSLPVSDTRFYANDTTLMAQTPDDSAVALTAFLTSEQELHADPVLLLEEPDLLPDYDTLNRFFETHQQLHDALLAGTLSLRDQQGHLHAVGLESRSLFDLPGMFWLQLVCGLAGMVICLMIWIPAQRDLAMHSFALTGLSNLLFTSAAAIYSTRELFISGELFTLLSGINHLGALLFSASLGVFLWNYPERFAKPWLTVLFYLAFAVSFVLDQGQWVSTPVEGFHLWVMGIFLFGLSGAIWQWLQTRGRPAQRSALRWVVISILAGTTFFAGGMILPAILQTAEPASQGLLFTTFLIMYAGMAIGVGRYRLFNLDRWWFSLWAWLLGGLLVMLTDLLLVSLLSLSAPASLTLAMAVVGWLYFPLRQYFWGKLFRRNQYELDIWLSNALPAMLEARQEKGQSGIEEGLLAVFRPLSIEQRSFSEGDISIFNKGESLSIPEPLNDCTWVLHHPREGEGLFKPEDINTANLVLALHRLIGQVHVAYEEGAKEERHRIRRDIHDDLGAKLLHLLHKSPADSKPLVREAIKDLRNLLKDMEDDALSLDAAILQWHEETARRCKDHGAHLEWHARTSPVVLGIGRFSELTRILREAVSNALKHSRTTTLSVRLECRDNLLTMVVENDGAPGGQIIGDVGGLDIMDSRAQKLGGSCLHETADGYWRVILEMPLDPV